MSYLRSGLDPPPVCGCEYGLGDEQVKRIIKDNYLDRLR